MQATLIGGAGDGALLLFVTEAQLDELHAEDRPRAEIAGDALSRVEVLRAGHAGVDLREQAQIGTGRTQRGRQHGGPTASLHVPRRYADPTSEHLRCLRRVYIDLVEAGELGQ